MSRECEGAQGGGQFRDRVVIVTGGGRGMGRGIARAFIEHSAQVMIGARTEEYGRSALAELRELRGRAELELGDVTKEDDIRRLIEATMRAFGRLDVVVHCAADVPPGSLLDTNTADMDRTLASIVKASAWLIQAAAPKMIGAGCGRIVLISSICGPRVTVPGLSIYGAAKAGLNSLISGAALELARHRITVNGVEPGITNTDNVRASLTPEALDRLVSAVPVGRVAEISDIARAVLFLASDDSSYITGTTITVDGGLALHNAGFPLPQPTLRQ
jgi:3-oxoacyl-[acyl-carrier protein] reductase